LRRGLVRAGERIEHDGPSAESLRIVRIQSRGVFQLLDEA
jgi:hypothetical protein